MPSCSSESVGAGRELVCGGGGGSGVVGGGWGLAAGTRDRGAFVGRGVLAGRAHPTAHGGARCRHVTDCRNRETLRHRRALRRGRLAGGRRGTTVSVVERRQRVMDRRLPAPCSEPGPSGFSLLC